MNIKMANGSSISMSDKGESVKAIFTDDKEIIAKQAEQIKMLREALILATPYLPFNAAEEEKAYQALEATKEQA